MAQLVKHLPPKQIPSLLANGRLSAKSASGYQRFAKLSAAMMHDINRLTVQTDAHAERFEQLGAKRNKIQVVGNIKFDINLDSAIASKAQAARSTLAGRPCFIAGSTHAGRMTLSSQPLARLFKNYPKHY